MPKANPFALLLLLAAAAGPTSRPTLHVTIDCSAAPKLKAEANRLAAAAKAAYPKLCRDLASPGYVPPDHLNLVMKRMPIPAATHGVGPTTTQIECDTKWFTQHPEDIGCVVHELTHSVQGYTHEQPGWVTEGIADWTRFYTWEPVKNQPHPDPKTAKPDASYRVTASFLNFCCQTYGKDFVKKLNAICREGKYTDGTWSDLTGRPLSDLADQWRASLAKDQH